MSVLYSHHPSQSRTIRCIRFSCSIGPSNIAMIDWTLARMCHTSTSAAHANAEKTAPAPLRYRNPFFTRISPTFLATSPKYSCALDFFTVSLHGAANTMMRPSKARRTFPRAGAYARDVKPPSTVCNGVAGGCGRRVVVHWVSWMTASSALLRLSGVDSRYVNGRFQILVRSICVAAECVSRSIPDGKGGVGESTTREAWPRALSQYGASWGSCFDGGLAAFASNTELAVSRASSGSISSDPKESKDVGSYAACERDGCEIFGRNNK